MTTQGNLLSSVKRSLEQYRAYRVARDIKHRIHGLLNDDPTTKVVSLRPGGPANGHVLLSHLIEPFLLKQGAPVPSSHTVHWEVLQVANTFLGFGYGVDVISFRNRTFIPKRPYSHFIDTRFNFERLAGLLNEDCVKILYGEIPDISFYNAAESRRLLGVQQRKGVTLQARRWQTPSRAAELADYIMLHGNDFTVDTFRNINKPIYRLPTSVVSMHPWSDEKDFEACRKRFLWFGSGGLVLKGLDLVLDAFADMPDYHLTICGPVERERDFEQAYGKLLYETPNIQTVGWVDTAGDKFREITRSCVGLVFPSGAEGQAGSVVACLHAGLIPIVSYESGVDVHDFGTILKTSSIDEIQTAVRLIGSLPGQQLEAKARMAWEYACTRHTRERYAEELRTIIATILAAHGKEESRGGIREL